MDPAPDAPRGGGEAEADAEGPSSSSAAAASSSSKAEEQQQQQQPPGQEAQEAQPLAQQPPPLQLSRYESQKRRDWNTFLQYLRNHKPPLALARCSGANVLEFLRYLDQFGKTKVHAEGCAYFGQPNPPAPCACPLRQAWGSLDALIGRLRAAYEESGGRPESNPFAARAVRIYLREVREAQAKARGIPYEKKKRKRGGGASTAAPAPQPSAGTGDATETSGRGQDPAQQTATVAPPSTGSTRTSANASASASTSGSASAAAAATTTMAATEREAPAPEPEGSAPGS